jgi:hypothetical protein
MQRLIDECGGYHIISERVARAAAGTGGGLSSTTISWRWMKPTPLKPFNLLALDRGLEGEIEGLQSFDHRQPRRAQGRPQPAAVA